MRMITSLLLLAGFAGPAIAHTGDGIPLAALSHQIFGLHHLPVSILLVVATIIAFGHWHSSKRSD
jgi:hypothetical protein